MTPAAAPRHVPHSRYAVPNRWVRWGKFALPVVAIGLGIAIFYLARVEVRKFTVFIGPDTEIMPEEIDSISMENARFSGRDDRNRSFTVTADKARQKSSDSTIIHLVQPKADLDLTDGRQVAIRAVSGIYVRGDQLLNLAGDVTVSDNRGFEFRTSSASVDLGKHTATGDAPVTGRGPSGDITSEGFQVLDDGDRVIFTGKTNLTVTTTNDIIGANSAKSETP
jgi:lipopolysaccharide export system protein LptC